MTNECRQERFDTLLDQYGEGHNINAPEARREWDMLRFVMSNVIYAAYTSDISSFMLRFLHSNRNVYPNLANLAVIGITLPVTSVSCERGISAYNSLKTNHRNALTTTCMNNLLVLYLDSKSLEEFDFEQSFELWTQMKRRRGASSMAKEEKATT